MTSAADSAALGERGIAGRERLDHELHPFANPRDLRLRLLAVQLHAVQPGAVRRSRRRARAARCGTRRPCGSRAAAGARCRGTCSGDSCRLLGASTKPSASASSAVASERVLFVGDPADLHEHRGPRVACIMSFGSPARPRGRAPTASDRRRAPAPRRRAPRRSLPQPCARASTADRIADSATAITSGGMLDASALATPRSSANVARLRLFTPTIRAPAPSARSTSAASCASTSTPSPSPSRERVQVGEQRVVGQGGDDQQDRVGADRARLVDLDLVDREVLAQHRKRGCFARGLEIGDRAAEVRPVGEHRQRAGAARFVRLRGRRRDRGRARGRPSTANAASARR